MALRAGVFSSSSPIPARPIRCSAGGKSSPAEDFAPLAAVFRRRLLAGVGTASLVAVGANFGGVTSFLLGLFPDFGRGLKLDLLYPVQGFTRCLAPNYGFEFIYPASWVGDRTLLNRVVDKAESQRNLDPQPLNNGRSPPQSPRGLSEPVVAFGPPGSNGELNVSVIVSTVPRDFSIEDFGGPKEVGETVLRRISGTRRGADIMATLIDATKREDPLKKVNYYKLEFRVEGPSFRRHNVAVCTASSGKLFTLNAQAPESTWPKVREEFYKIADSFSLTET